MARHRTEVYGILVAEAGEHWRARILTYPNMLWSIPGGRGTIKFVGASAQDAERQAIEFIREHCRKRGFKLLEEEEAAVLADDEADDDDDDDDDDEDEDEDWEDREESAGY